MPSKAVTYYYTTTTTRPPWNTRTFIWC